MRWDDTTLTPEEFLQLDARFHVALAETSGNTVIAAMMAGLRSSIEDYVLAGVPGLPDWTATSTRLRREHRGILRAVADGDAAAAHVRIERHITGYYAESRLADAATRPAASARAATSPAAADAATH